MTVTSTEFPGGPIGPPEVATCIAAMVRDLSAGYVEPRIVGVGLMDTWDDLMPQHVELFQAFGEMAVPGGTLLAPGHRVSSPAAVPKLVSFLRAHGATNGWLIVVAPEGSFIDYEALRQLATGAQSFVVAFPWDRIRIVQPGTLVRTKRRRNRRTRR